MGIDQLRIRRGRVDDLDSAAAALGAAFADDPWTGWSIDADDHVARITALQGIALELVGFAQDRVWLAEDDDMVIGVAVWSDSTDDVDPVLLTELADRSRPFHGDRLAAAIVAERDPGPRPDTRHRHLETTGVRPDHWRRGVGSAVLRPELDQADADGVMCSLETSTTGNTMFYRSLGFEIVHHRVVPGGGPDVWTMWRHPGSGRAVG